MPDLTDIAENYLRELKPCVHGGDIWKTKSASSCNEILDFSSNINPLGAPPEALNAIRRALWRIPLYPDPDYASLKNALGEYFGTQNGNIIVGNGSTELIYLLCELFVKQGSEVLIPAPTFGEYEVSTRRVGGIPRFFKLGRQFNVELSKISRLTNAKSRVIFICNPNNPTSTLTSKEILVEVLKWGASHNLFVVVDEGFIEFSSEPQSSALDLIRDYPNLFIIRSLTKFYGLAGLRVGYGIGSEDLVSLMERAKPPWSVNCLAEVAAIAALKDTTFPIRTRSLIDKEREFLFKEIGRIRGFRPFKPEANFILVNTRGTHLTGTEIKKRILKSGILVRDCSSFRGLDDYYIRVAVRTRQDNKKLLECLSQVVAELDKK